MARRSSLLVLAVLVQLLGPTRLDAQRTLSGVVRDAGGSILPGVSVRATSPALAEPRSALTNGEGRYSFGDLPDGTYTLTFALPGFVVITRSDIVLPQAGESPLDAVMRVGSLAETITILRGSQSGHTPRSEIGNVHHARDAGRSVDRSGDAQETGHDEGLHAPSRPATLPGVTPRATSLTRPRLRRSSPRV